MNLLDVRKFIGVGAVALLSLVSPAAAQSIDMAPINSMDQPAFV